MNYLILAAAILGGILGHYASLFAQNASKSKQFYAVIVGISEYKDVTANLLYADDDARAFYTQMRAMGVPEKNMSLLTNQTATQHNIINAMNNLFAKATPIDEVIFFFSGHGSNGLFVAHDNYLYHREVKTALKNSRAATKLLFADACFSGSLKSLPKQAPMPKDEKTAQSYYKDFVAKGLNVAVFASSRNNQPSAETPTLKGGIFTHYLLNALRGTGDLNGDRLITLYEMYRYVSDKVKTESNNKQIPGMFGKFNPELPIARVR